MIFFRLRKTNRLQVSYREFEQMEHLVSEGLKEGHKGIESAQRAQRRTHGSLQNPHQRTSASSVSLLSALLVLDYMHEACADVLKNPMYNFCLWWGGFWKLQLPTSQHELCVLTHTCGTF